MITGTFLLVAVCKKIGYCRFIEYYGRNSLIVMITNMRVMTIVVFLLELFFIPNGKFTSMLYIVFFLILYFVIQTAVVFVFSKKPLSYISGKWK